MALTTTTLSSAVTVNDRSLAVASATGFTPGAILRAGEEFMEVAKSYVSGTTIPVIRGTNGTATQAHPATENITAGTAADFAGAGPQSPVTYPLASRVRDIRSYSAAGAITLPTPGNDMVAIINGTGALAMTLVAPTKDQDGDVLTVIANGKAAHTITLTAGFGANTTASDVMTMHATQTTAFSCMACNGVWVLIGFVAGSATVAGSGLA